MPHDDDRLRQLLITITETPAPPFSEEARGRLVADLWRAIGLDVDIDDLGNVIAELPGGSGPSVFVAAHLDTVFPAGTDVTVRELPSGRLAAPGIGDNSVSIAALTHYAERAAAGAEPRRARVTMVATVGEEGLGDIRGARKVVADHGARMDVFVAVDGQLDRVVDRAVGSIRLEARFSAPGGHSWSDYGQPSAVHAAGEAIARLTRLDVASEPRSTMNVGVVTGGTSVNAIAEAASLTLDLRSLDPDQLARMHAGAVAMIEEAAAHQGAGVDVSLVGDRPAGANRDDRLVELALGSLGRLGIAGTRNASSTDANAALAAGIPAITIGVFEGGDAHRLGEWLDPTSLPLGYRVLREVLADLVDFQP